MLWASLVCIVGFVATAAMAFSLKEGLAIFLCLICAAVGWGLTCFFMLAWAALILLIVEGGRNLRVVRARIEQEKS